MNGFGDLTLKLPLIFAISAAMSMKSFITSEPGVL